MARLTSALLLGAALGASAHPSRHGHFHKAREEQRHVEKRGDDDWIVATAVIDGVVQTFSWDQDAAAATTPASVADTPAAPVEAIAVTTSSTSSAAATAAASSTAAASTGGSSSSSTSATGAVIDTYTSFTDLCSQASKRDDSKRATLAQIAAVGNVGSTYGCNMALTADAAVADQYNSYVKFFGATEDMTCYYWNKISKSGGINGFTLAEDSWYSFGLASGEVQYLVIDDGSYGGASCQPKSAAPAISSVSGAFAYTWVEWTMVDTNGYSCVDASCIVAQDDGQAVNGLEITAEGYTTTSSVDAVTGWYHNGWNSSNPDADGLGVQGSGGIKAAANFGFTSS